MLFNRGIWAHLLVALFALLFMPAVTVCLADSADYNGVAVSVDQPLSGNGSYGYASSESPCRTALNGPTAYGFRSPPKVTVTTQTTRLIG